MTALKGFGIFCCVLIFIFMFTGGVDDESIIYIYVLLGLAFTSFAISAICDAYVRSKTSPKLENALNKEANYETSNVQKKKPSLSFIIRLSRG